MIFFSNTENKTQQVRICEPNLNLNYKIAKLLFIPREDVQEQKKPKTLTPNSSSELTSDLTSATGPRVTIRTYAGTELALSSPDCNIH